MIRPGEECLPQGVGLSFYRTREGVWYAALWHWRQASVRAAALGGHDRQPRAVTANGCGNAQRWVKTVKHSVGTGQDRARPVMQQGAVGQVRAGP
jgi:hypothetical protein